MRIARFLTAAAIAGFAAGAAGATTITVTSFTAVDYTAATAGGSFVTEDFEGEGGAMGEGEVGAAGLSTAVGTFDTLGGTGSGGTVTGLAGNTGTELALRDGNTYGRTDQAGGRWYLDSNDTWGMVWDVATGGLFDRIVFALTDGSDVGGYLRIMIDGVSYEQRTGGRLANGNTGLVVIDLDDAVSAATLTIGVYNAQGSDTFRRNDGFSIDGAQVGLAPVPLPASLPLLALGAGALVVLRRRGRPSD